MCSTNCWRLIVTWSVSLAMFVGWGSSEGRESEKRTSRSRVPVLLVSKTDQIGQTGGGTPVPRERSAAVEINDRGEEARRKGELDEALARFNEAIRIDPTFAWPYNNRGLVWSAKRDFEKAIADYDQAIRLDPAYAFPYNNRGLVWMAQGKPDKALLDYTEAIRIAPRYSRPYSNRGEIWDSRGEFRKAIEDYAEAIQLDTTFSAPLNGLAWLRATCPDERYRAGKEAIEFATKACELTDWKSFAELDTLAAAYAEAGEYTTAVIWQMSAIDHGNADQKNQARERLELYQKNQPYHRPPVTRAE